MLDIDPDLQIETNPNPEPAQPAPAPVPTPVAPPPPAAPPQVFPSPPQGQISEDQWKQFEQQTDLSRKQILAVWSISQASLTNSPHTKVVEKEILNEAKTKLPKEFSQYDDEVKAEINKLSQTERINSEKIEELYYKVAGRNLAGKKPQPQNQPQPQRRIVSGVESGGITIEPLISEGDQIPANLSSDEKEIYKRYGFKSKKEFDHHNKRDISLENEENWKPVFK